MNAYLVIILVFLSLAWPLWHCYSTNQGYEIRGIAEQLIYRPDGAIASSNIANFYLVNMGERWRLSLVRHQFAYSDNEQYACDGTNCYYLVDVRYSKRRALLEAQLTGENDGAAIIIPGIVPRINPDSMIMIIWFAYLSHEYLDKNKGDRLIPPDVLNINTYNSSVAPPQRSQLVRSTAYPRLPQSAVFWEDGVFHAALIGPNYKPNQVKRWPPPYDQGFTNLIYGVRAATNLEFVSLPLESELLCFMPAIFEKNSVPSQNELRVHKKVRLQTLHIKLINEPVELLPVIPGLTIVQDRRFTNIVLNPVNYMISNRWLTEKEVKSLPVFRHAIGSAKADSRTGSSVSKVFVVSFLLCLTLLPMGYFFWKQSKNSTRKVNN